MREIPRQALHYNDTTKEPKRVAVQREHHALETGSKPRWRGVRRAARTNDNPWAELRPRQSLESAIGSPPAAGDIPHRAGTERGRSVRSRRDGLRAGPAGDDAGSRRLGREGDTARDCRFHTI